MANLFGLDIAGIVGSALGGKLLPATLIKVAPGTRDPGDLAGGTHPTATEHAAEGIVEDYRTEQVDGTLIQRGDRKVMLLAARIAGGAVPAPGDRVRIEGPTYTAVGVERDPAGASWSLQVRGP